MACSGKNKSVWRETGERESVREREVDEYIYIFSDFCFASFQTCNIQAFMPF